MNSKILLGAVVVFTSALVSQAIACDKHKHAMSAKPIMKPTSEMEGEVCFPYRYTNEKDKTQTLGMLRPRSGEAPANSQNTQAKPEFVGEDLTSEKKVIKPKKRKISKPKPAVKKDAYEEQIKPAPQPEVENKTIQPVAPEQPKESPIAPVAPITSQPTELPKAKEGDAGTVTPSAPVQTTPPVAAPQTPANPVPQEKSSAAPQSQTSSLNNGTTAANVLSNSAKVANLEYTSNEVEMSVVNMATLSSVVSDLKSSQNLKAKIHSYAFSDNGNMSDARRTSLQRAIKIRKYLIDNDISASRISVNAIEDSNSRMNKVEIQLAETN